LEWLRSSRFWPRLPSAQPSFDGAPDPHRGVFLKAVDPLDDPRHFCVDLPGHMPGVDLAAPAPLKCSTKVSMNIGNMGWSISSSYHKMLW
jgi:hypothetical protein